MKALLVVSMALAACAPDPVAPPPVAAPIEIAARPRPPAPPPAFHGVITSRKSQIVIASDAVVVKELRVAAGDTVRTGQVLAVLDDPTLRASLAKLPKRSKARTAIEKRLANLTLLAPSAGIVASLQIAAGASTRRGDKLLRIANTKRLQLRFALPQEQYALIGKGTKVRATIAGRAQPIDAIVRSIAPQTDGPLPFSIVDADLVTARDAAGLHGAIAAVALVN